MAAGGVAALSLLGTAAGPRWRSRPLERTVVPETDQTAVPGPPPGQWDVVRELVRLPLGRGSSVVEVTRPTGATGAGPDGVDQRFPVIVFAHGAGTGNHTAFGDHTAVLARSGIASVVPDKQLGTYTTYRRNYHGMAQEYRDLADWARLQPWADPQAVGYYGESEGAWVVPIAAAEDERAAFAALVSSPVLSPRVQGMFAAGAYLVNTRVPGGLLHAVPRFLGSPMPGGRLNYADFQVGPYQRRLTMPVFVAYGTQDASMPIIQGALNIIDDVAAAGNDAVTVRYYPDANHGLRVGEDLRVEPDFLRDLGTWVRGLPDSGQGAPRIAGAQPVQPFWAVPAPQVPWYGVLTRQGWMTATSLGLVAVGPLLGLGARLLGRPPTPLRPALRRPFALLTAGSVATVAGLAAYIARVASLAVNYRQDPASVVWGYRMVRTVAAASVTGGVALALRAGDSARTGQPPARTPAEAIRLLTGAVGATGLLALSAYWGTFPSLKDTTPPEA